MSQGLTINADGLMVSGGATIFDSGLYAVGGLTVGGDTNFIGGKEVLVDVNPFVFDSK